MTASSENEAEDSCDDAAAVVYSHRRTFTRRLAEGTTPMQAFERCLKGWRQDNLGLAWYIPKPTIVSHGDETTGVGFEVVRRPPLGGMVERIIDYKCIPSSGEKEEGKDHEGEIEAIVMTYKVVNPGPCTCPVKDHLGTIRFQAESSSEGATTTTAVDWTVEWIPLPVLGLIVPAITRYVIGTAVNYIENGFEGGQQ